MVIVAMLRSAPPRRRRYTAHSSPSSGRSPRTDFPGTHQPRPRSHDSSVFVGDGYGRFLELPVPVVLVVLWLLGLLLLGSVVGALVVVAVALA